MKAARIVALFLVALLAGCSSLPGFGSLNLGGGRLFGNSAARESLAPYNGYPSTADTRALVARIDNATVERTPTGLIVRAVVAVPPTGYRGVEIVQRRDAPPGTIRLDARLQAGATGSGATALATTFLSNASLAGVGEVTLASATNTITIRP